MRLMLFFDLPMLTDKDRREYNRFHKYPPQRTFLFKNFNFIIIYTQILWALFAHFLRLKIFLEKIKKNSKNFSKKY